MKPLVISDIHGDRDGLIKLLYAAGAYNDNGYVPGWETWQLGDLVHCGYRSQYEDRDTIEFAAPRINHFLVGNHELPFLFPNADFPRFAGMTRPLPETMDLLIDLWDSGRMKVATSIDDWLLTHAGVHGGFQTGGRWEARERRGLTWDAWLTGKFLDRVERGRPFRKAGKYDQDDELFDWMGRRRGGAEPCGGIFWCDFKDLSQSETDSYNVLNQIVGHSPQARGYERHGRLWCVDAGAKLSGKVSGIWRDTEKGSDWTPIVVSSNETEGDGDVVTGNDRTDH